MAIATIIPIIIMCVSASVGAVGTVNGGVKFGKAGHDIKEAEKKCHEAEYIFNKRNGELVEFMDGIGVIELKAVESFGRFSDLLEKIQGRPEFEKYEKDGIILPAYEVEEMRKISAGASLLLTGISGAVAGTAAGFAAAGVTSSAVIAFGTASTGTAISSLSGAAAVNATLAALGGGSIAAGGGGIAAGTLALNGISAGIGIMVGGIIFSVAGNKLASKAEISYEAAVTAEKEVQKIIHYFNELNREADKFKNALSEVIKEYDSCLVRLDCIINISGRSDWNTYTPEEKETVKTAVLLTGLLYKMCQLNLVKEDGENPLINEVNYEKINETILESKHVMENEIIDRK